ITEIVTKLQGSGASSSAEALPLSKTPKLARLRSWLWPASSGVAVADGSLGNGNNDDAARKEVASPILHWLLIGGKFAATAPELRRTQVTHVLNCSERVPFQTSVQTCNMPVFLEDEPDEELSRVLETAVTFLDEVQHRGGRCLVNCRKGMSRSVSIVLAYLILRQDLSLRAAWELVKTQRPVALPNTGFRRQLLQLELAKRGSSSMVAADFNA
ncbi:MKP1, partial [Symbiodinium microadriaticum]